MKYNEGEVWYYRTRPAEEGSTVLINKIEERHGRTIYHISVFGLSLASGGHTASHLPVGDETLKESLTELATISQPDPKYLEGYNMWNEAFENGKAGFFTIPISEIIDIIDGVTG